MASTHTVQKCSFCGKDQGAVEMLVAAPAPGVAICVGCVSEVTEMLKDEEFMQERGLAALEGDGRHGVARESHEDGVRDSIATLFALYLEERHPGTRWRAVREGEAARGHVRRLKAGPEERPEDDDLMTGESVAVVERVTH